MVHNFYREKGGEDLAFESEAELLRERGNDVRVYSRSSRELTNENLVSLMRVGASAIWNSRTIKDLERLLGGWRPDLAHIHNFFPLVSVSAFHYLKGLSIPIVHTFHNFRFVCLAGTLSRKGQACELCLNRSRVPGVVRRCYRGSLLGSAVSGFALGMRQNRGTWWRQVDCFFALSEFAREKFIESGIPPERIRLKPSYLHPDPGIRTGSGEFGLYAGRISSEKGIVTLLRAASSAPGIPLKIVGGGPLLGALMERFGRDSTLEFEGPVPRAKVIQLIKRARFVVIPSECYENFPLVLTEAFACGVPVIASRIGSLQELVIDNFNGLHFRTGDSEDLALALVRAWESPDLLQTLGSNARQIYERQYSANAAYDRLMDAYCLIAK